MTGDAVNTAARLQSAAPVGGVAVGLATWEATRRVFEYEELRAGGAEGEGRGGAGVPAAPAAGAAGVDLTRTHDSPFVGRRAELELLTGGVRPGRREPVGRAPHDRRRAGPRARAASSASSPDHVDRRVELVHWRQGRCLPYGEGIAFWALGEIVKAHAGILESDPPELAQREARDGAARGRGAAVVPRAAAAAARDRDRRRPPAARSRTPPGAGSSSWSRPTGRRCSCSRTCTGPARAMLAFLDYLAEDARACRCSSSRPRAPSCTTVTPTTAPAADGPARTALGGRDRPARRGLLDDDRAARRAPAGDPRPRRRQPAVHAGVRRAAARP